MATSNLGEYKIVITADYKDLQSQIKAATDVIKQSVDSINTQFTTMNDSVTSSMQTMANGVKTSVAEATTAAKTMGTAFETMGANVNNSMKAVNSVPSSMGRYSSAVKTATKDTNVFATTLSKVSSHLQWLAGAALTTALLGSVAGINNVTESTEALNAKIQQNLEMADKYHNNNQLLAADMNTLNQTAQLYAVGFGMSMNDVQQAMQILSRRFKDVASVQYLTSVALTMSKLDMVDMKKSAQDLEAVMLQFGLDAEGTKNFLNDFTVAVHTARVTGTDLLDALERSGAAFKNFHMGARESIAAVAALSTETARTGSTIGVTFKSIASNFDTKYAVKALQDYDIELYTVAEDGHKTMREGANVFQELMNLFNKLDDEGKRKLAFNLSGGKYQVNQMMSFLEDANGNFNKFLDEMKNKSSDEMTQELLKTAMDTYQSKVAQFKASLEVLAQTIGNQVLPKMKSLAITLAIAAEYLTKHSETVIKVAKTIAILTASYLTVRGAMFAYTVMTTICAGVQAVAEGATKALYYAVYLGTGIINEARTAVLSYTIMAGVMSTTEAIATTATLVLADAWNVLKTALIRSPIGIILLLLTALAVAAYELYEHWSEVKDLLIDLWNSIVDFISQAAETIINLFPQLAIALYIVYNGWQFIINSLKLFWQGLVAFVQGCAEVLAAIWAEIVNTATWAKNGIVNTIQELVDGIKSYLPDFGSWADSVVGIFGGMAEKIFGIAAKVKNAIRDALHIEKKGETDDTASKDSETEKAYKEKENEVQKLIDESYTKSLEQLKGNIVDPNSGLMKDRIGNDMKGRQGDGKSGSGGVGSTVDNSNEAQAWRFLKGKGLTNEVIAGLIGNWEVESPNLEADNWNSAGDSYGIGQWRTGSGRYQKLVDYATAIKGDASTLETQLNFAWHELTEGDYANALPKIAQESTNPENAAYAVAKYYEQPAWAENPERQRQARNIYSSMGNRNGELNITDYEKQQKSVEEIQKRQYDILKKQYDTLVAQTELELRRKNQYMTANDRLYLWNQVMGVNGGNVDFNSSVSTGNIGAAIVEEAKSHYEGEQWKAADNDDLANQCASFVTDVWKHVGITSVGSMNGNTMVSQAGSAYHTASSGYTPNVGDMINWAEHVGIYMGNGQYTARNSTGGVHTGSMAEAQQWFGSPEGYISVRELPDAKNISTKIFSSFSQFQKDNAQMIGNALKEKAELWKDKYAYNEAVTSAGGIDALTRLESTIQQSVNANKPLGKTEEKIYEEMLKVKGGQALQGSPDWYKAQTAIAKLYADNMRKQLDFEEKASQKHISALTSMTEKEMEWANKHNLVSDRQLLDYQINKNETNYAKNSGLMETELSKTANAGQEQAIVDAFHKMMQATTEEETKAQATHLMTLSKDTDATIKAIDKMQSAYEKYYQTREELAEKYEDSIRRYWFAGVSGLQSGLESAMDGILNKTKSFAQAFREIFTSVWKALVSQFSKEFASKITEKINPGKKNENPLGSVPWLGSYNAVKGMAQGGLGTIGTNWLMSGLLGGGSKTGATANGALSITRPLTQFSSQIFNTMNMTKNAVTSSMQAISSTSLNSIDGIRTAFLQGEVEKRAANSATQTAVTTSSEVTKTSVLANIGTMMTQMLAAMAIMFVLSSIFGGGGSSEETSTSSVNLGRNPTSYYSTPSTIPQVQVPSFDTGALQIPQDMLAMVHQNEMVIPADLADNIRSMGTTSNTSTGGKVVVHNNVNASAIDGRGIKEMLHSNNRTLAKSVKEAYRRFDTNV